MTKLLAMFLANPFRPDPRVHKEVSSLETKGVKTVLFCWDRFGDYKRTESVGKTMVVRYQPSRPSPSRVAFLIGLTKFIFWGFASLVSLRARLGRRVVVYCHDFDTLAIGVMGRLLLGFPFLYDAHEIYSLLLVPSNHWFRNRVIDFVELSLVPLASCVIAANTEIHSHLHTARRLLLLRNYPTARFHAGAGSTRSRLESYLRLPTIAYIGGFIPNRGLPALVGSAKWLRLFGVSARILLIGNGPLRQTLQSIACRDGTSDMIVFKDFVPYERLPDMLSSVHLMAIVYSPAVPIHWIATPNKLYESISLGIPVLVPGFGQLKQFVDRNKCGVIVDRPSPRGIAQVLHKLFRNRSVYLSVVRACERIGGTRFTWEHEAEQFVSAVKSVVNGRRKRESHQEEPTSLN